MRRCGLEVNIGPVQRAASLAAGTALVTLAVTRRTRGGLLLLAPGGDLLYRGATGHCHVLAALGIDTAGRNGGAVEVQRSLTIQQPRVDVYGRWRDPQSQPLVWSHFAEITNATEDGAHWRVRTPLGRVLEWDSRVVEDRDGELVRWEATSGELPNEGSVEFRDAPGDLGTEITLRVRFDPPGGPVGEAAARLLDDVPKLALAKALRRFKSLVETGEIPSTDRNPKAPS